MKPVLIYLRPLNQRTNARVDVRVADGPSADIYGTGGTPWEPAIISRPRLSIELMSPDMDGQVQAGQASFEISLNQLQGITDPFRLYWRGAAVVIHNTGILEGPTAVPDFWGYITSARVDMETGRVSITAEVSTALIDRNLLTKEFGGGGGLDGDAGRRGTLLPVGMGAVKNIQPVWFDATRNIGMIDGYGNTMSIDWLGEGLSGFGARVADYANYAALAAAIDAKTIPPGRWGTCVAQGLVGLGAPPSGIITVHATFAYNRPGAMMKRILAADHAAVPGAQIDTGAFDALDAAVNYPVHFWTDQQRNVKDLLEAIAQSCNATPLVSFQNVVTVTRAIIGGSVATLDRSGSVEPRVLNWATADNDPPYYRLKARAARPASVLTDDQVNYVDTLVDLGIFKSTDTYRAGNLVWLADGSQWIYQNATPAAGHTPPSTAAPDGSGNVQDAWWFRRRPPSTAADFRYSDGTPIEALKPGQAGATKNIITVGPYPPATPVDDVDIWVNTSVTPNIQYARKAGAWTVMANTVTQGTDIGVANGATTDIVLARINASTTKIVGNTMSDVTGGYAAGVYGAPILGPSRVEADIAPLAAYTIVGLDDDNTSYAYADLVSLAFYYPPSGLAQVYFGSTPVFSANIAANLTGKAQLFCDGIKIYFVVGGSLVCSIAAPAALKGTAAIYPKFFPFTPNVTYTGLKSGTWTDNRTYDSTGVGVPDNGFLNARITVNADGSLNNAGTGNVTAPGIGVAAGAGTTNLLMPIGSPLPVIVGNVATKTSGEGGWSGVVAEAQRAGGFIQATGDANNAVAVALGQVRTAAVYTDQDYYFQVYGNGYWQLFKGPSSTPVASGTYTSRAPTTVRLWYDGARVCCWADDQFLYAYGDHAGETVAAGLTLYPKALIYHQDLPTTNIIAGGYSQNDFALIGGPTVPAPNATADLILAAVAGSYPPPTIVGNRVNYRGSQWHEAVIGNRAATGGATASATRLDNGEAMFGLSSTSSPTDNYASIGYAIWANSSEYSCWRFGTNYGHNQVGGTGPTPAIGDALTVTSDDVNVFYYVNRTLIHKHPVDAQGQSLRPMACLGGGSLGSISFGALPSNDWQFSGGATKPADLAGRVQDTRNYDYAPSYYYAIRAAAGGAAATQEFKSGGFSGSASSGYCDLYTICQWPDSSGGPVKQTLTDSNNAIFERYSTSNTTWGPWGVNYNATNRPRLGGDLLDSGGAVLGDAAVRNQDQKWSQIGNDNGLRPSDGATVGATWGTNVAGRPGELTDGRIAAGLDGVGNVQRPLPVAVKTASNILSRSGGGDFVGDLAATSDVQMIAGGNVPPTIRGNAVIGASTGVTWDGWAASSAPIAYAARAIGYCSGIIMFGLASAATPDSPNNTYLSLRWAIYANRYIYASGAVAADFGSTYPAGTRWEIAADGVGNVFVSANGTIVWSATGQTVYSTLYAAVAHAYNSANIASGIVFLAYADVTASQQVTVTPVVTTKVISADFNGNIAAGILPTTIAAPKVVRGGADITSSTGTVHSVTNATGGCVGNVTVDASVGTVTLAAGYNSTGTYDHIVTVNGIAQPAIRVTVRKDNGSPPSGGGSGGGGGSSGGTFGSSGYSNSTTSYSRVGIVTGLVVSSGKKISGVFADDYYMSGSGKVGFSRNLIGKWRVSPTGANSWTDLGSGVAGSSATYDGTTSDNYDGSIQVNQDTTSLGLSAGTYDVELIMSVNIGGRVVAFYGATATVSVT